MATYGRFQIIQELHRTPLGRVATGKLLGDVVGARFLLKIFDPSRMGLLEADAATQTFLDRAGLQKQLNQRGAQNWALIHEARATDDGAYYVTDLYPATAQKLIDAQTPMTADVLHRLVLGVANGLLEIKIAHRRAHANLKPSNILLDAEDLNQSRPLLTDPAAEGAAPEDRAADLAALAQLVHQLVLHRRFEPGAPFPVPASEAWTQLGSTGERWREWCNWLLNPDPKARPADIDAAAVAVRSFVPRRKAKGHKWIIAATAAVVALGLGAFTLTRLNAGARAELDLVDRGWFAPLRAGLQNPDRRARFKADPQLAAAIQELEKAEAAHLDLTPGGESDLSPGGYWRRRSALAVAHEIERAVAPERWKRLAEVKALQQQYASRGWKQPADYLDAMARDVRLAPDTDLAAAIDRLLEAEPRIKAAAPALDAAWQPIDADLKVIEGSSDPVLRTFAAALRTTAAASIKLSADGFEGAESLATVAAPAGQLAALVRGGWPAGFGRERFARDVEPRLNLISPTTEDIQDWLSRIDQYALVRLGDNAGPVARLKAAYEALLAEVAKQHLSDADRAAFEAARTPLETKIREFTDGKFVKKDIAIGQVGQGEIALRSADLQRQLDQLRTQWVRFDDPKLWVNFIEQPLASTSEQLRQRWKAWVDYVRQRTAALAANPEAFAEAKKTAEAVRTALNGLDQRFPPVPVGMSEKFAAAAWDRREQKLAEASKWVEPSAVDPKWGRPTLPDPETTQPAAEGFLAWGSKLKDLDKDFPLTKQVLTPADRPDLKWKAKDPDFWFDPTVQSLIGADLARIQRVVAVNDLTRDELVKAALEGTPIDVALAAWRKLGSTAPADRVTPAWPTRKGELEKESDLRRRMAALVKGIRDPAERDGPEKELKEQAGERWRRFTNVADAGTIQAAARLQGDFGIDASEIAKLDAPARFNLLLFAAQVAAGDGTDAVMRPAVSNLLRSAQELERSPSVGDLPARLARVFDAEPMTDAHPGDAFNFQVKDSQYVLRFVRIAPAGMRPFYLATTEMSLGMFIDLVNASGNWVQANLLLGNVSAEADGALATFHGPMLWTRPTGPAQPIARFDTWRFTNARGDAQPLEFEPSLRRGRFNRYSLSDEHGGNPVYEHPMQQVTAQAALYAAGLANCRLPTAAEWQAAYEQEKQAGAAPAWNLRDQTWRKQQEYHPAAGSQWPDADASGVFVPRGAARPVFSKVREVDDGALLFRSVTSPAGSVFLHLVGNVAEIVSDAPDAFDAIPAADKRSGAGLGRFLQASKSRLSVIGGSALSSPDLDFTRPAPLPSATEPYADVGFRLAFTAPAKSVAERLKWVVAGQPYLVPARAAAE